MLCFYCKNKDFPIITETYTNHHDAPLIVCYHCAKHLLSTCKSTPTKQAFLKGRDKRYKQFKTGK